MKTRKDVLESFHDAVLNQFIVAEVNLQQLSMANITTANVKASVEVNQKIKAQESTMRVLETTLRVIKGKLKEESKKDAVSK